jgi:hypothetical protein
VSPRSPSRMPCAAGADVAAAVAAHGPHGTPHSPPSSALEHSERLAAGREQPEPEAEGEEVLDRVQSSQGSPQTRPWFCEFAPYEDKDPEDYVHDDDLKDD